jgi:hypothetical protein
LNGAAGILILGGCLAARPGGASSADPSREAERQAWLQASARRADTALEHLQAGLASAVDAARRGAALVVSGQDPPAAALNEAADTLDASTDAATAAIGAVARVRGTLACVRPSAAALPGDIDAIQDLAGIAVQLRESASAAGPLVERRQAAESTLAALGDALAALDRDDPQAALPHLDVADAALEQAAAWEEPPRSLAYWLETIGAMLAGARGVADAALAGDAAAEARAAAAYRAAAEQAARADGALELAIAESGSAVTVTPLRRLADALAVVTALRASLASVAETSG